jgi:type III secretion protein N (ATPase)
LAKYNEVELLLRIGEYKPGSDKLADEAAAKIDAIRGFLRQGTHELVDFATAVQQLSAALA